MRFQMTRQDFSQLEPNIVWKYFLDLCDVPRPSHHEEKIIAYLKQFAKNFKLKYKLDDVGNVLIQKPATKGMENLKKVIFQTHVDMVPQKTKGYEHNFTTDSILPYIDGEWLTAKNTTLGADNGMGIAAVLAVLASDNFPHGHLEALFTVDEEVRMTGVNHLAKGWLSGDILLNLDTEEEGEFYIGCAGGMNTDIEFSFSKELVSGNQVAFFLNVQKLAGGHSGADIHLGRGNAIKILANLLNELSFLFNIRVEKLEGGGIQHNVIPRESLALITLPQSEADNFIVAFTKKANEMIVRYKETDKNLSITAQPTDIPQAVMVKEDQAKILKAICALPNGVVRMSPSIPNLVETSTNIAYMVTEDNKIIIYTSQRSSVESEKKKIAETIHKIFSDINATVKHFADYPGWNPNIHSPILAIAKQVYQSIFHKEPIVKAIHAGLECGLLGSKYPNLDMISFGPTIRCAHSPDEKVEIASVKKFWDFLVALLKQIPVR